MLRRRERGARSKCRERTVDVAVHEMGVDEIGLERTHPAGGRPGQTGVDVSRAREAAVRNVELGEPKVERLRLLRRVVEAEEVDVDATIAQRGEQREQVPFGAADAPDAVEMHDAPPAARRGGHAEDGVSVARRVAGDSGGAADST